MQNFPVIFEFYLQTIISERLFMNSQFKRDLLFFVAIFGLLSVPFWFTDLDIWLQKPYYNSTGGWFMLHVPFWDFIYKYGIFLGYFVALTALVAVSISYWNRAIVVWRKAAWFLLFVMVVGPGILVNGTFKDHWGRPRPREITQFDGSDSYVKVWVKGQTQGKSFPCGHASMGFYLSVAFLFLRNRNKSWAWFFMLFGTFYGLLIGYARMIAGGHFASDVLWAAGIVWFTAIVAFHLFKIDKPVDLDQWDAGRQKKKGRKVALLAGILIPVLTIGILLATPYISKKEFIRRKQELEVLAPKVIQSSFSEGNIHVTFDTLFQVKYAVNGFGFPNSKIRWRFTESDTCQYFLERMGWFTEVRNEIQMKIPIGVPWENHIGLKEGKLFLTLPGDSCQCNLTIEVLKGEVYLNEFNTHTEIYIDAPAIDDKRTTKNNYQKNLSPEISIKLYSGKVVLSD